MLYYVSSHQVDLHGRTIYKFGIIRGLKEGCPKQMGTGPLDTDTCFMEVHATAERYKPPQQIEINWDESTCPRNGQHTDYYREAEGEDNS